MQEEAVCPHMIDPIFVLSKLPYPTSLALSKPIMTFDGEL